MKISLAFLILVTVTQFCASNILSKRGIQEELSSDKNGIQNGSDVIMVNPGPLDVILTNGSELVFEVCEQNCFAPFLVCFEGNFNYSYSTKLCDSRCGFYVNTEDGYITFMKPFKYPQSIGRPTENCTEMEMKNGTTKQKGSIQNYPSCLPKTENGIVKLTIMNATDECRVSVKNAKIKRYDVVTQADNSPDSRDGSDNTSAANYIGNLGWIFVLISFCILYQ